MRNFKFTKQGMLKAALIVVLAGNISWPMLRTSISSIDQASEKDITGATQHDEQAAEAIGGSGTSAPAAPATSLPISPNAVHAVSQPAPPPPAPVTQPYNSGVVDIPHDEINYCGLHLDINYTQYHDANSHDVNHLETLIHVTTDRAETDELATVEIAKVRADYSAAYNFENRRDAINKVIKKQVAKNLNKNCDDSTAGTDGEHKTKTRASDIKKKTEAKRLAADKKSCTRDSDGSKLDEPGRVACFLDRLDKADDLDDKSKVTHEVTSIVRGPLKDILKNALINDNSDVSSDDAKDDIKTAIESISELSGEGEMDTVTADRLTKELKAMLKGSAFHDVAEKEKDKAADLVNEMLLQRQTTGTVSPDLLYRYAALQQEIKMFTLSPLLASLNLDRAGGLMSQLDFNSFTSPFATLAALPQQNLQNTLPGFSNGIRPGTGPLPNRPLGNPALLGQRGAIAGLPGVNSYGIPGVVNPLSATIPGITPGMPMVAPGTVPGMVNPLLARPALPTVVQPQPFAMTNSLLVPNMNLLMQTSLPGNGIVVQPNSSTWLPTQSPFASADPDLISTLGYNGLNSNSL